MLAVLDALKWPAVVLIAILAAMLLFKPNVGRLIDRIKRFGLKGFDAPTTPPTPQPPAPPADLATTSASVSEPWKAFANPLELRVEEQFKQMIANVGAAEKECYLLRTAVRLSIQLHFERTYSSIYRSQLYVLEFLNAVPTPLPRSSVRQWYDRAAADGPALYEMYSYDQWLNFLEGAWLIAAVGDTIRITLDGREFLKFIIDRSYSPHLKRD